MDALGSKLLSFSDLAAWREQLRQNQKTLVVTNGCFDVLHVGHAYYLQEARSLGDSLLVGVNSDWAVAQLKGSGRPINSEEDRAKLIAALESVNAVFIFPELRATDFLKMVKPDIYVKGGDYTVETIPQDERRAVEDAGGTIKFLLFVPGRSSSAIVERIKKL